MIIRLPVPPSTNALFVNRKRGRGFGRIKSRAYRDWQANADQWLSAQWRKLPTHNVAGPCSIAIRVPKVRGDISNRIKAAEDFLVSRLITADDSNNRKVSIEVDPDLTGKSYCEIEIASISADTRAEVA